MDYIYLFLTLGSMLFAYQTPAEKSILQADKLFAEANDPLTPAQKSIYENEELYSNRRIAIKELLSGGRVIVLDDNSRWIVRPQDYIYSGGWLSPAYVRVKVEKISTDDYPYTMKNLSTHQIIRVNRI